MSQLPAPRDTPVALGMLSVLLGIIGLLLFLLPILGLPISAFGFIFGIIGTIVALTPGGIRLRWSLLGSAVSALALAINLSILYAPGGYLPAPAVPPPWQPVPNRPYVPPPARVGQTTTMRANCGRRALGCKSFDDIPLRCQECAAATMHALWSLPAKRPPGARPPWVHPSM